VGDEHHAERDAQEEGCVRRRTRVDHVCLLIGG
jgi:hypothetical protein